MFNDMINNAVYLFPPAPNLSKDRFFGYTGELFLYDLCSIEFWLALNEV